MASAVKSEYRGLFFNGQEAIILRTTLEKLGRKQHPTTILIDNYTAVGLFSKKIKIKKITIHGYAIPLGKRYSQPGSIHRILGSWLRK